MPPLAKPTSFQLTKWYLDVVTEAGEVAVLYWARLEYHTFGGTYAGLMHRDVTGRVRSATSLRAGGAPEVSAGPGSSREVAWSCSSLGATTGVWRSCTPTAERELWRSGARDRHAMREVGNSRGVVWSCIAPAADATLVLDGRTIRGTGYVERLHLSAVPWSLPIRELRWGRWIGRDDATNAVAPLRSVVWIDWRGTYPLTLIVRDGQQIEGSVGDQLVRIGEATIALPHDATLCEGPIGITALAGIPGVNRILPAALLATHEHKWLDRSVLHEPGGASAPAGWAIHELVRFGASLRDATEEH